MSRIECVPNISEGRRQSVIDEIVAELAGVDVLHRDSDVDHNRTVLTFVGDADAVADAAFLCVATSHRLIDLAAHQGVHPRRGACDVVPFVPLEATMDECAALARSLAARVESELGLTANLYGAGCEPLPAVRKAAKPGSVCIGARDFLIAFNVQLESGDLELARRVAREMRTVPGVRALGFRLPSRGCVQVSMNLIDFRVTGVADAFVEVERRSGVPVRDCEIVGMIPRSAMPGVSDLALRGSPRVLEGF